MGEGREAILQPPLIHSFWRLKKKLYLFFPVQQIIYLLNSLVRSSRRYKWTNSHNSAPSKLHMIILSSGLFSCNNTLCLLNSKALTASYIVFINFLFIDCHRLIIVKGFREKLFGCQWVELSNNKFYKITFTLISDWFKAFYNWFGVAPLG